MNEIKVLLIEDDADDHAIIKHLLSKIPDTRFLLDWVTHYDSALKSLATQTYDICLLDFRLGAHDGLEVLEKAGEKMWETPIIFLTGQGEYEVDIRAMNLGASDYLVKDQLTTALLERSIRYTIGREISRKALQKVNEQLEMRVREKTADLAAANRQLQEESEKIKLFAYSVSHDLKNPAVSLYGLTERLFRNYGDILDEKGRTHCRHIMQSAHQIAMLTERINQFISSKESPLNTENLDLQKILSAIRREFSEQLQSRNLKWSHPEELPVIRADRICVERILRNLVDNAVKYGGDGLKEIQIGLTETKHFWILTVSDDGIGIRVNDPDRIFGPFTRAGAFQKTDGLGLGLAIVKEIAGKHKGEVWTEPGRLGGASISVSIAKELS
ncbi:MAG: response regulator [Deltaproteobacteria bacterium]|nr:response regulator [Deltaproteobacteria bacterium]